MRKRFIKIILVVSLIITAGNLSFANTIDVFIRNSSEKDMQIKLKRKSDGVVVHTNQIPATRTINVKNLKKGSYTLLYKYIGNKIWRVMRLILLKPDKTFVLF